MGIIDFLSELGMDKKIKYNFNAHINDFKRVHPDVSIYREHDLRPCPYYFMYENSHGDFFAEFYASYAKARRKWEALKNNNDGSMTIFSLDYMDSVSGFYSPKRSKK